jgi:hypothetical protein
MMGFHSFHKVFSGVFSAEKPVFMRFPQLSRGLLKKTGCEYVWVSASVRMYSISLAHAVKTVETAPALVLSVLEPLRKPCENCENPVISWSRLQA